MTIKLAEAASGKGCTHAYRPSETLGPPRSLLGWQDESDAGKRPAWRDAVRDGLLTLATLGLYRCWVRTRLNQRIWRAIRLGGQPLTYTGTVRDLLVPMLAAMGAIAAVLVTFALLKHFAVPKPRLTPSPLRLLVSVPLVYLLGLAAWSKRAQLLERTQLGLVPGRLVGSRHGYALTHLLTALATAATLGWIIPWRQLMLQRRLITGMRLGPHRLTFKARPRALLKRFAAAWLGVITVYLTSVVTLGLTMGQKIVDASRTGSLPVLDTRETFIAGALACAAAAAVGLIAAWYRIGAWRHMADMTKLDGHRLELVVSTKDYLKMVVGNTALRLGTLFLAAPVADLRQTRFLMMRLRSTSGIDRATVTAPSTKIVRIGQRSPS
ncbi:MAG: DUF898 family protein [Hyphomicrobiaceae bacterium]